jgi:hypothetical protein
MTTSTNSRGGLRAVPAVLLAAGLILTAAGCAAVSGGPTATPVAPVPASASQSASPTATPVPATPLPTPAPSDPGNDGMPITVNLANATNHNVYIDIVDQSGKVVSGTSGRPGDGATVATGTLKVENVDSRTLRLTWTDIPGDNALALYIDKSLTHFVLVQPQHEGDAIPFDRILILKFSESVSARYIKAVLQTGTETVG